MEENAVPAEEAQPGEGNTPPYGPQPELAEPQIAEAAPEASIRTPVGAPALLTGEEEKARDQAHAQRAVSALQQAAEALRAIEGALESAVNKSVSGAKSTLICFAGRLDHEVRELSRHA